MRVYLGFFILPEIHNAWQSIREDRVIDLWFLEIHCRPEGQVRQGYHIFAWLSDTGYLAPAAI